MPNFKFKFCNSLLLSCIFIVMKINEFRFLYHENHLTKRVFVTDEKVFYTNPLINDKSSF